MVPIKMKNAQQKIKRGIKSSYTENNHVKNIVVLVYLTQMYIWKAARVKYESIDCFCLCVGMWHIYTGKKHGKICMFQRIWEKIVFLPNNSKILILTIIHIFSHNCTHNLFQCNPQWSFGDWFVVTCSIKYMKYAESCSKMVFSVCVIWTDTLLDYKTNPRL